MQTQETAEMYLETILMLKNRNGEVRSIDIAREMGYSKPTISIKMKQFREEGYISVDENGYITLEKKGLEIAEKIYERHQVLSKLLMALGIDEKTATDDACKIEHDISPATFEALKAYHEKFLS